jgi:hypothetical protein
MRMRLTIAALIMALSAGPVAAGELTDVERSCFDRANLKFGKYWLLECLQEVFAGDPYHLAIGIVAPGAGTIAVGPAFTFLPHMGRAEGIVSGEAVVSTDTSWMAQMQAVFAVPSIPGTTKALLSRKAGGRYGGRRRVLQSDSELDAKSSITFGARLFDAKEQPFYGLGPFTSLAGGTAYSLKQTDFSAAFDNPLTSWSSAGVSADFIRPRIVSPNGGVPLASEYSAASAPGLNTTDDFVQVEPYLTFKVPPRRSPSPVAQVGFSFYRAIGDPRFSFRRLSASTITDFPIRLPVHSGSAVKSKRHGFADFLCQSSRSGEHCSAGDLLLTGRLDATYSSAGSTSPFFLDPTLGGTDISGSDTLRGFGDYRFRAPNRVLLQAEYQHPIWSFLGIFGFYDVGKVALQPSALTLGQLRHDIGVGLYVSVANHQLARFYVAFGTGEPVQIQPKFGALP